MIDMPNPYCINPNEHGPGQFWRGHPRMHWRSQAASGYPGKPPVAVPAQPANLIALRADINQAFQFAHQFFKTIHPNLGVYPR